MGKGCALPTEATLSRERPQRKQLAESSRSRQTPLTCALTAGPAGGASVRRLSDWARLEILGRASEAERSRGLATLADGRAADGPGRPLFVGTLSVIGSLRFPWGRGAAAGPGSPSGWARGRWEQLRTEPSAVEGTREPLDPVSVGARGLGTHTPPPGDDWFLEGAGPRERPAPRMPG
ncbi:hypothetical protein P7K49_024246 [Saguinus oedipus]|uniref:Uncharacterized protein n=1 Tax=Saguinus oedipus TaxID=9490 RepID=A0ABQ9UP01_SAGOE|nr:hypothetical protein P7K49_024246 [Saguinus oedipus]